MFISIQFWIFVFVVLLLYNITSGKQQNIVLLVASYVFYAYFDVRFLWLLGVATAITYILAIYIGQDHPYKRAVFIFGLLLNIGTLILFKVGGLFSSSLVTSAEPTVENIIIPLGISFYSFRLLSYLFDVYNNRVKSSRSFINFALYISFFAQIASGPIERSGRFLPSLEKNRRLSVEQFANGLAFIALGFLYKIAIADFLAAATNPAFSAVKSLSSADALSAMIAYSAQLYADFAGYSAMAIGISVWFGLPAMQNFRQPYFSQSIIEFWTRWHISLSTWFRDYLFYPLSRYLLRRFGSKYTFIVQSIAYLITMIVTGLWHGVNWNFVIWGVLFGSYMVVERVLTKRAPLQEETGRLQQTFNRIMNIVITYLAVSIAWIFFRMPTVSSAVQFFQRLFQPIMPSYTGWWFVLFLPIILLLIIDLAQSYIPIERFWMLKLRWRVAIGTGLCVMLIILGGKSIAPFVYFKF